MDLRRHSALPFLLLAAACTAVLGEADPAAVPAQDDTVTTSDVRGLPHPWLRRGSAALPASSTAKEEAAPAPAALPAVEVPGVPEALWPADRRLLTAGTWPAIREAFALHRPRQAATLLEQTGRELRDSLEAAALQGWALILLETQRDALRLCEDRLAEVELRLGSSALAPAARAVLEDGRARLLYVRAHALYEDGRRAEAWPVLRELAGRYPKDLLVLERGARAAVEAGDGAGAVLLLDRRHLLRPLDLELRLLRIEGLALAGRHGVAVQAMDRLLVEQPDDPALWFRAGRLALEAARAGEEGLDYEGAAALLEQAALLDPQSAGIQHLLGVARAAAGDASAAEEAWRRALELEPDHLEAAESLFLLLQRNGRGPEALQLTGWLLRQPLAPEEVERVEAWRRSLGGAEAGRVSGG